MNDTITTSELLALIVRSGKKLLLAALVFAILLGGFQVYSQNRSSQEAVASRKTEEYNQKLRELKTIIQRENQNVQAKQTYAENSLLMQLNPYSVYDTSITLAVTDIDQQAFQQVFEDEDTPIEYLTGKIISQYLTVWNNQDLPQALGLSAYADVLDKYLREIVSIYPQDGGVLCIRALGNDAQSSAELADAAYRLLLSKQDTVVDGSYRHDFSVMGRSTKNIIDDSVRTTQENLYDTMEESRNESINARLELKELIAPSTGVSAVVKFAIVGAVVGFVLAALWVCLKGIVSSRLLSSYQLERTAALSCLGSVAAAGGLFGRQADRISRERVWKDQAQAVRYIADRAQVSGKTVLLTSTLPLDEKTPGLEALSEALTAVGAKQVRFAADFLHDPAALESAASGDCAVLLERVGATDTEAVAETAAYLKKNSCDITGFVLV